MTEADLKELTDYIFSGFNVNKLQEICEALKETSQSDLNQFLAAFWAELPKRACV